MLEASNCNGYSIKNFFEIGVTGTMLHVKYSYKNTVYTLKINKKNTVYMKRIH